MFLVRQYKEAVRPFVRDKALLICCVISFFNPLVFHAQVANVQDSLALVDLYMSTNGTQWKNNTGWLTGPVKNWFGVTLNYDGRVGKIVLINNNLNGSINTSIGQLTAMTHLDMPSNLLSGNIPSTVGNCINIQQVWLYGNRLTGNIPESIGQLAEIWDLDLSNNNLSGSIPASIGNLKKMQLLMLYTNQLSGVIPDEIGACTALETIYIGQNQFTGSLPTKLGQLSRLKYTDFSNNKLTGSIPESIGNIPGLVTLYLSNNQLAGQIPSSLGNCKDLWSVSFSDNQLTGSIPASLGNCTALTGLRLTNNQLSGSIPPSLQNTSLVFLYLDSNQLTDSIPLSVSQLKLNIVHLENNRFTFRGMEAVGAGRTYTSYGYFPFYSPQDSIEIQTRDSFLIVSTGGTPSNNTFRWFRNGVLETIVKGDTSYKPKGCGIYRVEITNSIATRLTLFSKTITVKTGHDVPKPIIDPAGSVSFCEGSSVLLKSNLSSGNEWYFENNPIPGASNSTFAANQTGSYTVKVNQSGCSVFSDPTALILQPIAKINITASAYHICAGAQVHFLATATDAGSTPLFQWKKNQKNVGTNSPVYDDNTLANNDTIMLELTANTVCRSPVFSNTIVIDVDNRLPVPVNLGRDTILCGKSVIQLNAGPNFMSYKWQDGSTDSLYAVTTSGDYSIEVRDACGRVFRDTISIKFEAPVDFDLGTDQLICKGDTAQLTAPAGFSNYHWSPANNVFTINGREMKAFPTVNTTYIAKAQTSSGCYVTDSLQIKVLTGPIIDLGKDTAICKGDSLKLFAGNGFSSYAWSNGNNTAATFAKQQGSYWVKAQAPNGCFSSDTVKVQMFDLPQVFLNQDSTLCTNSNRILNAGAGYISYSWNTGSLQQKIDVSTIGLYSVDVIDQNGCKGTASTRINRVLPPPSNFLPNDTSMCNYSSIVIKATPGFVSYAWSSGEKTPTITVSQPTKLNLEVTDKNGCKATESVTIKGKQCMEGVYVPTAFTPNHDGKNDNFKPSVFGKLISYRFTIYDRWGHKVFDATDATKAWDGSTNGAGAKDDVYIWVCAFKLQGKPEEVRKGTVALIR